MVNIESYPANKNLPGEFDSFHEQMLSRIPSAPCIRGVRGDTALCEIKKLKMIEDKKPPLLYGIGAPTNEQLRDRIWSIHPGHWLETTDLPEAGRRQRPPTWDKRRTSIIPGCSRPESTT